MIHEGSVLSAIKNSGIAKIAVIDDAFDAPEVDSDNAGHLLQFIENVSSAAIGAELGISALFAPAKDALESTEYDADALVDLVVKLYDRYVLTGDDTYNPGGMFGSQLANINYLRPILELLNKCDPKPAITRIGSDRAELAEVDLDTHLIFIDFYLDKGIGLDASANAKREAKEKSLERIVELLRKQGHQAASVILMSWQDVSGEAEKFRERLTENNKSLVFASRFGFLSKKEVVIAGGALTLQDPAADTLIDIFQSYQFGRSTHAALEAWLESAKAAVDRLRGDIEHLQLKDFAYLLKFRLAQENQGLLSYLEWFFGECLLDGVGRLLDDRVKEDAAASKVIARLDLAEAKRIEGAFDGATTKVAELYHRVRIENPHGDRRTQYRLGDLYLINGGKSIVAVITPDCDLITRSNGKRIAPRLLTVSGDVKAFDAPESSVADFIFLNDKPYNIVWNTEEVQTKEFDAWPKPGTESKTEVYAGTLRPLYAQALQGRTLSDLGRVGLSVAPALGMSARAKVFLKTAQGPLVEHPLADDKVADCYVVPKRGGSDKPLVLFKRRFIGHLQETLVAANPEGLHQNAPKQIAQLKRDDAAAKLTKMLSGVRFEKIIDFGIYLTAQNPPKGDADSWCVIQVVMAEDA